MKLLKSFFNNNFYFWFLGLSFVFISYISIHQSLVVNRTYNLIPYFLVKFCLFFITGQILSIFIFNFFLKIELSSKYVIIFIFLLGCYSSYFLIKFF